MKNHISLIVLTASALTLVSCAVPHTAQLTPMRDVEQVERQAAVTHNPNGIEEALQARTAANYSSGRRFGLGYGF